MNEPLLLAYGHTNVIMATAIVMGVITLIAPTAAVHAVRLDVETNLLTLPNLSTIAPVKSRPMPPPAFARLTR